MNAGNLKLHHPTLSAYVVAVICIAISTVASADQTCDLNVEATAATAEFIDHQNGTVTDNRTGLMWKKCPEGLDGVDCSLGQIQPMSWTNSLKHIVEVNAVRFANYSDWRLPNKNEIDSIMERSCNNPAINLSVFPNTDGSHYYWTSTPFASGQDSSCSLCAWRIYMKTGEFEFNSIFSGLSVRLVRSGR